MLDSFNFTHIAVLFIGLFAISASLYGFLFLIKRGGVSPILRKTLYIPATKSETMTLLLGGIPVNAAFIFLFAGLPLAMRVTGAEQTILWLSLILFIGVLFYGYLDDRYEIRPIVKLFFQIIIMATFSALSSKTLYRENTMAPFLLNFFLGMMTINGANLLDGLDTLSFKIFFSSLIYISFISWMIHPGAIAVFLSVGAIISALPFYFFNRAPAKVYLGEIGAASFAIMLLALSNFLYLEIRSAKYPSWAFVSSSYLLMIYGVELSMSFMRRLLNRKSPFKGDKLHIHHLLNRVHKISASNVGTIYGVGQAVFCFAGFFALRFFNHWLCFLFALGSLMTVYILLGRKHWQGKDFIPINLSTLFNLGLKRKVKIIPDNALKDFQIHLTEPAKEKKTTPQEDQEWTL